MIVLFQIHEICRIFTVSVLLILEKANGRKVPNMDVLRKHLLREGHLNKPELIEIITEATNILSKLRLSDSDLELDMLILY